VAFAPPCGEILAMGLVPREKLWRVLQEYGVGSRQLLAIKYLYSYSEVYVRVDGVKSQPFTVGIGLRHRCMLSPLLFISPYMNWMNWTNSHSRVNRGVTVGSCTINRLLFAGGLVLLASSEQGLQHALNRLLLRATKPE